MCCGWAVGPGPQLSGERVEGLGPFAKISELEDGLGVRQVVLLQVVVEAGAGACGLRCVLAARRGLPTPGPREHEEVLHLLRVGVRAAREVAHRLGDDRADGAQAGQGHAQAHDDGHAVRQRHPAPVAPHVRQRAAHAALLAWGSGVVPGRAPMALPRRAPGKLTDSTPLGRRGLRVAAQRLAQRRAREPARALLRQGLRAAGPHHAAERARA